MKFLVEIALGNNIPDIVGKEPAMDEADYYCNYCVLMTV